MQFDKKTVIAFLLLGAVLLLVQTPFYQKTFFPNAYRARMERKQQKELMPQAEEEQIEDIPQEPEPAETKRSEAQVTPKTSRFNRVDSSEPEKVIHIETRLYTAVLSSRGASLSQFILKAFPGPDGTPVKLLPPESTGTFGVSFFTIDGDTVDTFDWMFTVNSPSTIDMGKEQSKTVTFTYNIAADQRIVKVFRFYQDRYDFDLDITFENLEQIIAEKRYIISAPSGLASTEHRLKDDMMYAKAGISSAGSVSKNYRPNNRLYQEDGTIDWVGVKTKYFALMMQPKERKGIQAWIAGAEFQLDPMEKAKWKRFSIALVMPFLSDRTVHDRFMIYLGPQDYALLKDYGVGLEKFMDMGMKLIQPISQIVLWSFKKLHTVIPNYGVVLIIFAILVKIIVYPLTHKSFESMKKMQTLQPKLTELREKYGSDPQRLNKETMKLYKESGVNPLGSCLPMVLQMPLLFALFNVFRTTIELRGEGFVFWIKDLSMPDTVATLPFSLPIYGDAVNILPLFMGATMLIQQKMSSTDPKQKAMVYMMPIFLTLLFNSFPSGLNLYYALFNIMSIIQQKITSTPGVVAKK